MMKAVAFALTLVAAQTTAGLIMVKVMMSDRALKAYVKKAVQLSKEMETEMEEYVEKD